MDGFNANSYRNRPAYRWSEWLGSKLVSLVDLPGLTSEAVSRIINTPGEIVVAAYDAKRGHPVKFASSTWPELIKSATGDQGARSYIAEHPDQIVLVEVGDVATGEDMDVRPTA